MKPNIKIIHKGRVIVNGLDEDKDHSTIGGLQNFSTRGGASSPPNPDTKSFRIWCCLGPSC